MFRTSSTVAGCYQKEPVVLEEIDSLRRPIIASPLDQYLAPEPVLLLSASRGATGRGVIFVQCRHRCALVTEPGRGLVHEDIVRLRERHNARCFAFSDDCVVPAFCASLRQAQQEGPEVYWQCEVRFEER